MESYPFSSFGNLVHFLSFHLFLFHRKRPAQTLGESSASDSADELFSFQRNRTPEKDHSVVEDSMVDASSVDLSSNGSEVGDVDITGVSVMGEPSRSVRALSISPRHFSHGRSPRGLHSSGKRSPQKSMQQSVNLQRSSLRGDGGGSKGLLHVRFTPSSPVGKQVEARSSGLLSSRRKGTSRHLPTDDYEFPSEEEEPAKRMRKNLSVSHGKEPMPQSSNKRPSRLRRNLSMSHSSSPELFDNVLSRGTRGSLSMPSSQDQPPSGKRVEKTPHRKRSHEDSRSTTSPRADNQVEDEERTPVVHVARDSEFDISDGGMLPGDLTPVARASPSPRKRSVSKRTLEKTMRGSKSSPSRASPQGHGLSHSKGVLRTLLQDSIASMGGETPLTFLRERRQAKPWQKDTLLMSSDGKVTCSCATAFS